MRIFGFVVSLALHAGILAWAMFSIGQTKPAAPVTPKPVNVDIITTAELTRLQKGVESNKAKADAKALEKQRKKAEPKVKESVRRAALPARPKLTAPQPPRAEQLKPPKPETKKPEPKPEVKKPKPQPEKPDPIASKLAEQPDIVPRPTPKPKPVEKAKPEPEKPVKPAPKKVAEKKPEVKPEPKPEAKPEPKTVTPPKPEPKKVEVKKPEPKKPAPVKKKPAPVKKAEKKPETKKADKPKKPKRLARENPNARKDAKGRQRVSRLQKRFNEDEDSLAALLNNDDTASDQPVRKAPRTRTPARPSGQTQVARRGTVDGTDNVLTISEKQALVQSLRRQVENCWSPPTGAAGAEKLAVRMRISFRKDGTVVGAPQVLNPARTVFFLAASDSALRAVLECQPYRLPPNLYEHWKSVDMNFDPSQMFGG